MMDNRGQVSSEFLFLFGVLILVVMLSIAFVSNEQELNVAMSAARSGANEGVATSSSAIYPDDTFRDYYSELVSIGDRINYNLRKSIAFSFNSTASTNKLYNPVFSPHYVYTTANVKWI